MCQNTNFNFRYVLFALVNCLLFTAFSFAQENPWNNEKPQSNPWYSTNKEERKDTLATITTQTESKSDATMVTVVKTTEPAPEIALQPNQNDNSKNLIYLGLMNDTVLYADRNDPSYLKLLSEYGGAKYKAIGGSIGAGVGSAIFPIISIPISMITPITPTNQQNKIILDFIQENDNLTRAEVKAVNRGIRRKRFLNTGLGALMDNIASLAFWYTLFNL